MKLAIIGASTGQLPLTLKAKELGHTVISFAWENGAVCKEYVDKFYPISILEKDTRHLPYPVSFRPYLPPV